MSQVCNADWYSVSLSPCLVRAADRQMRRGWSMLRILFSMRRHPLSCVTRRELLLMKVLEQYLVRYRLVQRVCCHNLRAEAHFDAGNSGLSAIRGLVVVLWVPASSISVHTSVLMAVKSPTRRRLGSPSLQVLFSVLRPTSSGLLPHTSLSPTLPKEVAVPLSACSGASSVFSAHSDLLLPSVSTTKPQPSRCLLLCMLYSLS